MPSPNSLESPNTEEMERVAVIIPNWNGKRFLVPCLASLRAQTFTDFAVYVVDNGSTDGSVDLVRSQFPEVRVVGLPGNQGFSAAINAGIANSRGEYVAALNNDTEADPRWLEELVTILDARPEIGFCASKVLDYSDRGVIDSFGDGYRRTGVAFKFGELERDSGQFAEPLDVFSACAAASIYRRSMLADIGTFDEDFFCYLEDVDLGIRAQLAGYRCLAVPSARVFHIGSASTGGDMSEFSLRMTAKNIVNILLKDIPGPLLLQMIPLVVAGQTVMILESLLTNRRPKLRKHLRGYLQGLVAALRQAPAMLRKRPSVQKCRRITVSQFADLVARSEAQKRASRRRLRTAGRV
jgi:hypothetical protein